MTQKIHTFEYPSTIDGEPEEVREAVLVQLRALSDLTRTVCQESYLQLRAAGLGRLIDAGRDEELVLEWEDSAEGLAIVDVVRNAVRMSTAVDRLLEVDC